MNHDHDLHDRFRELRTADLELAPDFDDITRDEEFWGTRASHRFRVPRLVAPLAGLSGLAAAVVAVVNLGPFSLSHSPSSEPAPIALDAACSQLLEDITGSRAESLSSWALLGSPLDSMDDL